MAEKPKEDPSVTLTVTPTYYDVPEDIWKIAAKSQIAKYIQYSEKNVNLAKNYGMGISKIMKKKKAEWKGAPVKITIDELSKDKEGPLFDDALDSAMSALMERPKAPKPKLPPKRPAILAQVVTDDIKTQKAKGFQIIQGRDLIPGLSGPDSYAMHMGPEGDFPDVPYNLNAVLLPQCEAPRGGPEKERDHYFSYPLFARPCPVRPRHGFIDSRLVHSADEARALLEEVQREDPDGELLLTRPLSGEYSAVATTAGVSYGLRNDGVTGSKSKVLSIPTPSAGSESFLNWMGYLMDRRTKIFSMVTEENPAPYIEVVEDSGHLAMVQLRMGPEQPTTKDFIPAKMTVKKVVNPMEFGYEEDLLGWEKYVKELVKEKGAVISIPEGSLASHHAVHGITLGIPVVTSRYVSPGDVLAPTDFKPHVLLPAELQALKNYIERWEQYDLDQNPDRIITHLIPAVGSIHAQSLWDGARHLLDLRAMSVVVLSRAIAAASFGELRHFWHRGPGRNSRYKDPFQCLRPGSSETVWSGDSRTAIYSDTLRPISSRTLADSLACAVKGFDTPGWSRNNLPEGETDPKDQCAYGGPKWADVARAAQQTAEAIDVFKNAPTLLNWETVVLAANLALNTAHNGGVALNKWVMGMHLDVAAKNPFVTLLNPVVGSLMKDHLNGIR